MKLHEIFLKIQHTFRKFDKFVELLVKILFYFSLKSLNKNGHFPRNVTR